MHISLDIRTCLERKGKISSLSFQIQFSCHLLICNNPQRKASDSKAGLVISQWLERRVLLASFQMAETLICSGIRHRKNEMHYMSIRNELKHMCSGNKCHGHLTSCFILNMQGPRKWPHDRKEIGDVKSSLLLLCKYFAVIVWRDYILDWTGRHKTYINTKC